MVDHLPIRSLAKRLGFSQSLDAPPRMRQFAIGWPEGWWRRFELPRMNYPLPIDACLPESSALKAAAMTGRQHIAAPISSDV